jgi:hypothetical protein
MMPNPRRGAGSSGGVSSVHRIAPFDDAHTCPCGGPIVRRRDGRPGYRCGLCGRPAGEVLVRVRVGGCEGWAPRSAVLTGRL